MEGEDDRGGEIENTKKQLMESVILKRRKSESGEQGGNGDPKGVKLMCPGEDFWGLGHIAKRERAETKSRLQMEIRERERECEAAISSYYHNRR